MRFFDLMSLFRPDHHHPVVYHSPYISVGRALNSEHQQELVLNLSTKCVWSTAAR